MNRKNKLLKQVVCNRSFDFNTNDGIEKDSEKTESFINFRTKDMQDYLLSLSILLAAVRPDTKISTIALPPKRLPP